MAAIPNRYGRYTSVTQNDPLGKETILAAK